MMRLVACALVIVLAGALPASAGAWLRDKGAGFLSSSVAATVAGDTASTTYLEYGLTGRITLGLDVLLAGTRLGNQGGYATAFLRYPLGPTDRPAKWALEAGVGGYWIDGPVQPQLKTGLAWGRGFTLGERSGWMGVEASVMWDLRNDLHLAKIDATVGIQITKRTKGMFQIFLADLAGTTSATFAPSLLISPGKQKYTLQIGAEIPDNGSEVALKIGFWRTF